MVFNWVRPTNDIPGLSMLEFFFLAVEYDQPKPSKPVFILSNSYKIKIIGYMLHLSFNCKAWILADSTTKLFYDRKKLLRSRYTVQFLVPIHWIQDLDPIKCMRYTDEFSDPRFGSRNWAKLIQTI